MEKQIVKWIMMATIVPPFLGCMAKAVLESKKIHRPVTISSAVVAKESGCPAR
jgi:hypothetical protein